MLVYRIHKWLWNRSHFFSYEKWMFFHFFSIKNNQSPAFLLTGYLTSTSSERAGQSCDFTQNSFRCLGTRVEPVSASPLPSAEERRERWSWNTSFSRSTHLLLTCPWSRETSQCCSQHLTVPCPVCHCLELREHCDAEGLILSRCGSDIPCPSLCHCVLQYSTVTGKTPHNSCMVTHIPSLASVVSLRI